MWTGFIWLRIGTIGDVLMNMAMNFVFITVVITQHTTTPSYLTCNSNQHIQCNSA
jgi:hypothetical protein